MPGTSEWSKKSERSVTEPSYLALLRVIRRQIEKWVSEKLARNRDGNPRCGEIGDTAPRDGVLLIAWVAREEREEQGENRKEEEMRTVRGEEGRRGGGGG